MAQGELKETKAVALLPNLKIEILHARSAEDDAERLSINLLAYPSFEAFGRYLEAANPFLFWPWLMPAAWPLSVILGGAYRKAVPGAAAKALESPQKDAAEQDG
jgi:hypothetical protein